MVMSVFDALQAWQDGKITASRAMALSGAADVAELYELCAACDVEMRTGFTEQEDAAVENVVAAIRSAQEPSS